MTASNERTTIAGMPVASMSVSESSTESAPSRNYWKHRNSNSHEVEWSTNQWCKVCGHWAPARVTRGRIWDDAWAHLVAKSSGARQSNASRYRWLENRSLSRGRESYAHWTWSSWTLVVESWVEHQHHSKISFSFYRIFHERVPRDDAQLYH